MDEDDAKTLATIRNVCEANTSKRNVILDRYVASDYLSEYTGMFNRHNKELVSEAVKFAKTELLGKEKSELGVVSASYGDNVLTDRDIHIQLYCDAGTHLFVTKNKRESEVLFHDGLTYEFFNAEEEEYSSGLFGTKCYRLVLMAYVKYGGLAK